jgi:hypothetical protein
MSRAAAVQYLRADDEDLTEDVAQDSFEVLATDSQAEAVTVVTLSFAAPQPAGPPSSREEVVTLQVNEGESLSGWRMFH